MGINKRRDWGRKRKKRIKIPEGKNVFLMYCGKCTEPEYFNFNMSIIKVNKEKASKGITKFNYDYKVVALDPKGMAKRVESCLVDSKNHIDEFYVVFDKDSFKDDNFDNAIHIVNDLNKTHKDTLFIPLWSNECLELWFVLYFEYLQAQLHRQDYFKKMETYLNLKHKYQKNTKDISNLLIKSGGKLSFAIENAYKLLELSKNKTSFSDKYPATNVVYLFNKYYKYL